MAFPVYFPESPGQTPSKAAPTLRAPANDPWHIPTPGGRKTSTGMVGFLGRFIPGVHRNGPFRVVSKKTPQTLNIKHLQNSMEVKESWNWKESHQLWLFFWFKAVNFQGCFENFSRTFFLLENGPIYDTVDGSVEVGSLSHYLQGFLYIYIYIQGGAGFLPSIPSTVCWYHLGVSLLAQ